MAIEIILNVAKALHQYTFAVPFNFAKLTDDYNNNTCFINNNKKHTSGDILYLFYNPNLK